MSDLIPTIGLETHVQLKTNTKIWCSCPTGEASEPNVHICPVCMGYPGSLPVLNEEAVRLTVLSGLMLGCTVNLRNKHDRKSYFYPDMPKNYQITQYDLPICDGGEVPIVVGGKSRTIKLTRIHLEEDVAKNTHFESSSGIDFNRAGTPLMEIVTEPDIYTADEALAYVQALKQILLYGGVSDCHLEDGNMRCDVNCSVALPGAKELGVKTEIKNMNTFKGLHRALSYEIKRQIDTVSKGGAIVQETRRWDDEAGVTSSMRTKEYAHDYRYFPDPDLMPIVLTSEQVSAWKDTLPELPVARKQRFVDAYGLPEYDADLLVGDKALADFFEATVEAGASAKSASNWLMGEMLRAMAEAHLEIFEVKVSPASLASLVKLVDDKVINQNTAKELFNALFEKGGDPKKMVAEQGLAQVSDTSAIDEFVEQAISENEKVADDYRGGKGAALQFLVGQVMRFSKGKANPQMAAEALKGKLDS